MKVWPALASATYIGCAGLTLHGCTQFDDRGLFTAPSEGAPDAGAGTSGAGGARAATSTATTTSSAASSSASTSTTSTGVGGEAGSTGSSSSATGGSGGAAGDVGSGGTNGAGGAPDDGGAGRGGGGRGGTSTSGSSGGAAGTHGAGGVGGGGGAVRDAGVPKVCVDLHTAASSAHETAQACMQAGSLNECRLVQDECGCGAGVRAVATQATQRYLMAVQALKDNGCFDACPDGGCPPYAGATCTPGTQSRLQCIAY